MHPNNRQWEYPPGNGYSASRNVCPPRFAPCFGPLQMSSGPPRCAPPLYPHPYPTRCNISRNAEHSSVGNQHTSSYGPISPRKRGPHTPPGPPPDDQPASVGYNSLSKNSNNNDNFDYPRPASHWQQKRRNQRRASQSQHQRNQQCNIRGRRNSFPLPQLDYKRQSFQNNVNAKEEHSSDRDTSTSALNSAVQSYLLQVLTTQPPPNVLPTPYLQIPSTSSTFPSTLLHNDDQARPPLPPTPVRPEKPPPPPSDEENWDTPSEDSNDGSNALKLNSANQEKLLHFEGNVEDTFSTALAENINNAIENEDHLAAIHSNVEYNAVIEKNEDSEQGKSKDYNSFKIKLPTRSIQQVSNVVDNVVNEPLNTNGTQSLQSALTIVIPNPDNQTLSESILKIVTPENNIQNIETDSREVTTLRATPPGNGKVQSHEMDVVKDIAEETTVGKRKIKRRKTSSKDYPIELAEKVLRVEEELARDVTKENVLILKFPDPPLSHEMVKGFCKDIETVHFQQNTAPRYCFVHLKDGADVVKSIKALSKISFGHGTIKAEIRNASTTRSCSTKANNIDPFTLYVGNLSTTLPCKVLKEHFPGASRICVGFARRMKCTRYAFIQYQNVEDSIAAFRRMHKCQIEGRSLIIRFKRLGSAAADEDGQTHGNDDSGNHEHVDTSSAMSSPLRMPPEHLGSAAADEDGQTHSNDDSENLEQVDTSSAISSQLRTPPNMREDIEVTNNHSQRNVCNILQNINKKNINCLSEDCSEEANLQDIDRPCEVHSPNNNQLVAGTITGSLNDLTAENRMESVSQIKCLENSNLRLISNKETSKNTNAVKQPVGISKECEKQTSPTQTERNADVEEIEIASVERNENSNSNTVETEMLDGVQGEVETVASCSVATVKSETPTQDIEDTEKIVYSVPSQRMQNLKNGVHCVNKFEYNEDFEFFSDRTSRRSSSSVDASTERPPSTNSHRSLRENTNPNSSDPALETIMASNSAQRHIQDNENKEKLSQKPAEERNLDLQKQALRGSTNLASIHQNASVSCKTNFIDDESAMRRQFQSQRVTNDCIGTNEDLVPPNALLLRRGNILASNDVYSIDAQELQVKQEQIEVGYPKNVLANKSKEQGSQLITKPRNSAFRKRRAPSSLEHLLDVKPLVPCVVGEDDDDLVPANCALNMFQKPEEIFDLTHDDDPIIQFKREAETQDLYSLPTRTSDGMRQTKEMKSKHCINDVTSIQSSSRNCGSFEKNKERNDFQFVHASGMPPSCEEDNDVVIIGDTLTPRALQQFANESFRIKHEGFSPTSIEKSFFDKHKRPTQHRDNLDRLFALLNSNSDEES